MNGASCSNRMQFTNKWCFAVSKVCWNIQGPQFISPVTQCISAPPVLVFLCRVVRQSDMWLWIRLRDYHVRTNVRMGWLNETLTNISHPRLQLYVVFLPWQHKWIIHYLKSIFSVILHTFCGVILYAVTRHLTGAVRLISVILFWQALYM